MMIMQNEVRLIDANALLDNLEQPFNWNDTPEEIQEVTDFEHFKQLIINAPTIDSMKVDGNTSDGYHTFNELYGHRAKLFAVIVSAFRDRCWKSKRHNDNTMYDGMFIVGIETPNGQATYHYNIDPYWDMFDCKELIRAPKWDGHTPRQAIDRIASMRTEVEVVPVVHAKWLHLGGDEWACHNCWNVISTEGSWEHPHQKYCDECGAKMDMEVRNSGM